MAGALKVFDFDEMRLGDLRMHIYLLADSDAFAPQNG